MSPGQTGNLRGTVERGGVSFSRQSSHTDGPSVPDRGGGAQTVPLLDEVRIVVRIMKVDGETSRNSLDGSNGRVLPLPKREGIILHDVRKFRKEEGIKNHDPGGMRELPNDRKIGRGPSFEGLEGFRIDVIKGNVTPDEDAEVGMRFGRLDLWPRGARSQGCQIGHRTTGSQKGCFYQH